MRRVTLFVLLGLLAACGGDEEKAAPPEGGAAGPAREATREPGTPEATVPEPPPMEVDPILALASGVRSGDEEERLAAAGKLGEVDKEHRDRAIELILPLLADGSADVRQVAVQAYAKLGTTDLAPLRGRLRDETDALVQRALVEALFQLGGEAAIIDLRGCAADELAEESVRVYAIEALGRLKAAASRDILEKASEDISAEVRRAAVIALGRIGEEGSLKAIGERVEDNDTSVQVEAVRALKALGNRKVVRYLALALESDDPNLLREVNAALEAITGQKMGYEAEKSFDDNLKAIEKWRAWWKENEKYY